MKLVCSNMCDTCFVLFVFVCVQTTKIYMYICCLLCRVAQRTVVIVVVVYNSNYLHTYFLYILINVYLMMIRFEQQQ